MADNRHNTSEPITDDTVEPLEGVRTPLITFKVEHHIVQLPVAPFIEHSPVFKKMFERSNVASGGSDNQPLALDDSFEDIKILASYFNPWCIISFPSRVLDLTAALRLVRVNQNNKDYLVILLRLSAKYDMKQVFYKTCIELQSYTLDAIETLRLTSELPWMPLECARTAFHQMVEHEEPMSVKEAFQIKPDFLIAIVVVRERRLLRPDARPTGLFGQPAPSTIRVQSNFQAILDALGLTMESEVILEYAISLFYESADSIIRVLYTSASTTLKVAPLRGPANTGALPKSWLDATLRILSTSHLDTPDSSMWYMLRTLTSTSSYSTPSNQLVALMDTIPPELHLRISRFVILNDDGSSLRAWALTCTHFHRLFRNLIYHTLRFDFPQQCRLQRLVGYLSKKPSTECRISHLWLRIPTQSMNWTDDPSHVAALWPAQRLLELCGATLQHLVIIWPPSFSDSTSLDFNIFGGAKFPSLRSLTLHNLLLSKIYDFRPRWDGSIPPHPSFPNLQKVHVISSTEATEDVFGRVPFGKLAHVHEFVASYTAVEQGSEAFILMNAQHLTSGTARSQPSNFRVDGKRPSFILEAAFDNDTAVKYGNNEMVTICRDTLKEKCGIDQLLVRSCKNDGLGEGGLKRRWLSGIY
ncbi:hypothetical protein DL96DRAFT_1739477 [Flagelloscypha sp. PMI_526]|nr:hypothetical protein DL96DRAFT_1739477 [Flagelloscypha sp. PMI_526]